MSDAYYVENLQPRRRRGGGTTSRTQDRPSRSAIFNTVRTSVGVTAVPPTSARWCPMSARLRRVGRALFRMDNQKSWQEMRGCALHTLPFVEPQSPKCQPFEQQHCARTIAPLSVLARLCSNKVLCCSMGYQLCVEVSHVYRRHLRCVLILPVQACQCAPKMQQQVQSARARERERGGGGICTGQCGKRKSQ